MQMGNSSTRTCTLSALTSVILNPIFHLDFRADEDIV
jgi:hypothetical protein